MVFRKDLSFEKEWRRMFTSSTLECNNIKVDFHIEGAREYVTPSNPYPMHALGAMWGAQNRSQVSKTVLENEGFGGWWNPQDFGFARVTVGLETFPFVCTTPWDGSNGGRMGVIIENSPKRDKELIRTFLDSVDTMKCIIGEAKRGWTGWDVQKTL